MENGFYKDKAWELLMSELKEMKSDIKETRSDVVEIKKKIWWLKGIAAAVGVAVSVAYNYLFGK